MSSQAVRVRAVLTRMQFRAALAYWGEGLTQEQIATRFMVRQPAIANRLQRARAALQRAGLSLPDNPARRERPTLCCGWAMDSFPLEARGLNYVKL